MSETTTDTTVSDDIKKAQFERDSALGKVSNLEKQLKELQGKLPTDDQVKRWADLEAAAAKAEEDRAKKAGEWDSLRNQLVKDHDAALATANKKAEKYEARFRANAMAAEFGGAVDMFGGTEARTILDPAMARDVLGRFVTIEEDEDADRGYRVLVKRPDGSPILGADGNPAPFAEAIGKLIEALPNKDRLLRGSGKTGSGSSGGQGTTGRDATVDVRRPMSAAELRDPKVRAQLRDQMAAAGGLQVASAIRR